MANIQHLAAVKKGGEYWNSWRNESQLIVIDLSHADLSGMCLNHANLSVVDLSGADLSSTQLSYADLRGSNLSSTNLSYTDFSYANLDNVNFDNAVFDNTCLNHVNLSNVNFHNKILKNVKFHHANLVGANLSSANLSGANLSAANLSFADLSHADLRFAKLSNAQLKGADFTDAVLFSTDLSNTNFDGEDLRNLNLSNANLSGIRAVGADFSGSVLTGACIENWIIDEKTIFDNITCEFFYFKSHEQERRPSDPNQNFKAGEFFTLVQKVRETVDLIFLNGIDWAALLVSIHQLQIKSSDNQLSIQAIENKGDGDFVVRVTVPPDSNKAEIEKFIKEKYESERQVLESSYRSELKLKDAEIDSYRRENANLMKVLEWQSAKPIVNTEKVGSIYMPDIRNISINSGNYNESINTGGGSYIQGNYINMSQDLTEAASQIQDLLEQLQKQGVMTNVAQEEIAKDLATQVQNNPKIKDKLVLWGQSLGSATVSDVVKGIVKLAIKSAGIPLP